MKRIALLAVIVLLMSYTISMAQTSGSYETLTPGDTVTSFTVAKYAPTTGEFAGQKAFKALVTVKTNSIHWTVDGTTPAAATGAGMITSANSSIEVTGLRDIQRFKFLDAASGSASSIRVTYFFQ